MNKRILEKIKRLDEKDRGVLLDVIDIVYARQKSKCYLCKKSNYVFAEVIDRLFFRETP